MRAVEETERSTGQPVAPLRRTIRVASVPADHVYVRHTSSPAHDGRVVRLPDPAPTSGDGTGWWPPRALEPDWVEEHHEEFDVMHVHFGFDAVSPDTLRELVQSLRHHRKPLVLTVHDLRNPHQRDPSVHDAQLDVLVPGADALVTLTDGAQAEIRRRWSRWAAVLPHPHVVPLTDLPATPVTRVAPAERGGPFVVGMHVKSLRACMDPVALLPVLDRATRAVPGGVLRIDGHTDVLDPTGARFDPRLALALERCGDHVEVRVHDYFTDDDLFAYLAGLDLSILPYRWGTHSGWLETCRDVGTPVAAPTCGHYADQGPVLTFGLDTERFDEASLEAAVHAAWAGAPPPGPTRSARETQRDQVADAHRTLYAHLLEA